MDKQEYKAYHDRNWQLMPLEMKEKLITFLQEKLAPDTLQQVRDLHAADPIDWMTPHHHFSGMTFRNILRECVKDSELPPVDYDGYPSYNWDDYYVAVLEAAAGVREL